MDEEEYRYPWRDAFRSLWFLPTVFNLGAFILGALASGFFLSRVVIDADGPLATLVFQGDASAAPELLIVVSGTMITVTSLVFVLTVVALQIASTQFSPRLLCSFLEDPGPGSFSACSYPRSPTASVACLPSVRSMPPVSRLCHVWP